VVISSDNGLTTTNGNVQLSGALTKATTVTTTSSNTLALAGLQTGSTSDNLMAVDSSTGVLKTISQTTVGNAIATKTAAYTVTATDDTILVDASGASVTITLPATPVTGKKCNVKKIDASSNTVSVSGNSHTIDGSSTISGTLPYQGWIMQYDGTNWFIIGRI
jgi:hypothetical protein